MLSAKTDTHVDGTVHTSLCNDESTQTYVTLFRKFGELKNSDITKAQTITSHLISNLENIEIHPVLITQLIVTCMGASVVFHRDKRGEHPEAGFHSAFFRINTLITTFSNLSTEKADEFKVSRQFKHEPLRGLWYKHVEDASISGMARNILNETNSGSWVKQSLIDKFGPLDGSEAFGEHRVKFLTKQFSEGAIKRRFERKAMSGEWLIFEKTENGVHVLTLASHQEADERIMARINGGEFTASPNQ